MFVVKLISYFPSTKGIELTFFSGVYGTCVGKYCYCTELTFSSAAMFKQVAKIKIQKLRMIILYYSKNVKYCLMVRSHFRISSTD